MINLIDLLKEIRINKPSKLQVQHTGSQLPLYKITNRPKVGDLVLYRDSEFDKVFFIAKAKSKEIKDIIKLLRVENIPNKLTREDDEHIKSTVENASEYFNFKRLNEIKINKGLQFPINVNTPEEAEKIKKALDSQGYKLYIPRGLSPERFHGPFEQRNFTQFEIFFHDDEDRKNKIYDYQFTEIPF